MNVLVLAFDSYPIEKQMEETIEFANLLFYVVFVIEMTLKIIGFGWRSYLRDKSNVFDMVIVVLSTFDVVFFI